MDSLITASARALAKAEDCRLGGLYCLRDDSSRLGFDPHSLSPQEINTAIMGDPKQTTALTGGSGRTCPASGTPRSRPPVPHLRRP